MARSYRDLPVHIPSALQPLIASFLNRRLSDLQMIRQSIKTGEFGAVEILAHKWRGHGAAYGFPALSQIGADLELSAQSKDFARMNDLIIELELILNEFIERFGHRDA